MRIVFQGDSITDAKRDKRNYHDMGQGYPKYATELIAEAFPEARYITDEMMQSASLISFMITVVEVVFSFAGTAFVIMPMASMFYAVVHVQPTDLKSALKYCLKGLPVYLLMSVKVFLWSLLFIVPGIIKAISYSMSFFVKIENPEMSASECITRSTEIMHGRKGAYFTLMLSYLFYYALAYFAIGASSVFIEVIVTTLLGGAELVAVYLSFILSAVTTVAVQTFVDVRWRTSEAVFYEDAKRSWLEEVEVDLRFKRESGDDLYSDPYSQGSVVTDLDVGDGTDPFGEKTEKDKNEDRKIDPFE